MTWHQVRKTAMDWVIEPIMIGFGAAICTLLWVMILKPHNMFLTVLPLALGPMTFYGLLVLRFVGWPRLRRSFLP